MFDETISCVQLDLLTHKYQVPQKLTQLTAQLEAYEKLRMDQITPDIKAKMETLERNLTDLKRQQLEIVESSIKNMFELATMVAQEKEELLQIDASKDKLQKYQEALELLQKRNNA